LLLPQHHQKNDSLQTSLNWFNSANLPTHLKFKFC